VCEETSSPQTSGVRKVLGDTKPVVSPRFTTG
jgi:hypothetical protein